MAVAEKPQRVTPFAELAVDRTPVSSRAVISYSVPTGKTATLALFDANGRRVATIARGLHGQGSLQWSVPGAVRTGMYFADLRAGSDNLVSKLAVLR